MILMAVCCWATSISAQCNGGHTTLTADMWRSCEGATNPNEDRDQEHWIEYDFGANYILGDSHFWNFNVPGSTDHGMQDVVIDYSMDGENWMEWGDWTFTEAMGTSAYAGEPGPLFDGLECRFLLISIDANHGGACYGFSELKIDVEPGSVGTPEAPQLVDFGLYPNPARDLATVQLSDFNQAHVRLLDLNGALISIVRPESPTVRLDVANLPAGMYLVQVVQPDGRHTTKRLAVTD